MGNELISIILPVYNQAEHIDAVVREYAEALKRVRRPYEMILAVNGSRDNSYEVCATLAEEFHAPDAAVRLLHSKKGGWGLGVKMGLAEAKGDIICYTNSARTAPAELVSMLLFAIAYPEVVIKANRKIRESAFRRIGSLMYNIECRSLFNFPYWDVNGTPKVFPRAFGKLLELERDDDLFDLEFNAVCARENYQMLEVPVFSSQRHGGKSTTNIVSALRMYKGAWELKKKFAALSGNK